jgi:hypothetical protein
MLRPADRAPREGTAPHLGGRCEASPPDAERRLTASTTWQQPVKRWSTAGEALRSAGRTGPTAGGGRLSVRATRLTIWSNARREDAPAPSRLGRGFDRLVKRAVGSGSWACGGGSLLTIWSNGPTSCWGWRVTLRAVDAAAAHFARRGLHEVNEVGWSVLRRLRRRILTVGALPTGSFG